MVVDNPMEDISAKKRLLRGALGDFDIGIHGTIVLVERETGRFVLLVISHQNDRTGKDYILAWKILRKDPGSGGTPGNGYETQEDHHFLDGYVIFAVSPVS
jgi:hypothetical protein